MMNREMNWVGMWDCGQCGHPNNEHDVAEFEKNGETFIQCKECPNVINVKHVPPREDDPFFWRCRKCDHYNDPDETVIQKDGHEYAVCSSCFDEERIDI